MSQAFKLRFDQMRESDPTDQGLSADPQTPQPGSVNRHLGLRWPNGRRAFLNYAYLIKGEFDPGVELNHIWLDFSAYVLTLQGYCLEPLFLALLAQEVPWIVAIDPRYVVDDGSDEPQVVEITLSKEAP